MAPVASYVQRGDAGVYVIKNNNQLTHRPVGDSIASVCEYEPASVVTSNSQDVSVALEVMSAVRVEVCTPSDKLGVCLEGRVKFITASVRFGIEVSRTDVYTSPSANVTAQPYATLSGTKLYGRAELSFLAVDISLLFRFFFYDSRLTLKK